MVVGVNRIEETAVLAQKKCGELAGLLREQQWHALDKKGFEMACDTTIREIKELQKPFEQLEKLLKYETLESEKEIQKKTREMALLLKKLEQNLELEQKKSASKLMDFEFMPETEQRKYNEQFSSLQHQTATWLLQTNYALEKLMLETKKDSFSPVNDKSTAHSLLELLKQREHELQETKKTLSHAKRTAVLGSRGMEGTADAEEELQKTNQKIAVQQQRLEESLKHHGQSTEKMFQTSNQLRLEMDALQQTVWNHFQKSQELVTQLKKERDFARQLALDTEMETLGLRSQYSHELLNLQERVVAARQKTRQEFEERLSKMEKELEHKSGLVQHFKDTVVRQSQQLNQFQEKNLKLRLLLETLSKHSAVKKAFTTKKPKKEQ